MERGEEFSVKGAGRRWADVEDELHSEGREACQDLGGSIQIEIQTETEDEERRLSERLKGREEEGSRMQNGGKKGKQGNRTKNNRRKNARRRKMKQQGNNGTKNHRETTGARMADATRRRAKRTRRSGWNVC